MKPSSSDVGSRANALWGRGGRHGSRGRVRPVAGGVAVLAAVAALALPAAGVAAASPGAGTPGSLSVVANAFGVSSHQAASLPHVGGANGPVIPANLLKQVQSNPKQVFHLILQGKVGSVSALTRALHAVSSSRTGKPFKSIPGLTVAISGKDLLKVAQKWPNLLSAITVDQTMKTTDYQDASMWTSSADVTPLWNTFDPNTGEVSDLLRRRRRSRSSTAASTSLGATTSGSASSRASTSARSAPTAATGPISKVTARWSPA